MGPSGSTSGPDGTTGGAGGSGAPRKPSFHRRFKAARRKVAGAFLSTLGPSVLRRLAHTWRLEVLGLEHMRALGDAGCMIAIWHGRMLLGIEYYRGRRFNVLVSPSADGSLSKRMLDRFGYRVIRGSTSRGGARALRVMLGVLDAGEFLVITPDGPRGPRHGMNHGLAWMARATGYPIIPLGMATDRAWHANSWDDFTIPKPRARVVLWHAEPVRVSRDGGEEELERATETIRERLLDAETRAFERLGTEPDW